MFEAMIDAIREETVRMVLTVRIQQDEKIERKEVAKITGTNAGGDGSEKKRPVKADKKIGPNDPCPCGSGKKYKKCCGNPANRSN